MLTKVSDQLKKNRAHTLRFLRVLGLCLIVVSLASCFPYARTSEDTSGFRDNIIDNAIKAVPLVTQTQRNKNEIYSARILTAFLSKFPARSDVAEAVSYLSTLGSQCVEDREGDAVHIRCSYETKWPFTVYEMWGPFQMFQGDVLRQGEVSVQVTLSIQSSKRLIESVNVLAAHKSTKPISPWRSENE